MKRMQNANHFRILDEAQSKTLEDKENAQEEVCAIT